MIGIEEETVVRSGTPLRWLIESVETSYVTPAGKRAGPWRAWELWKPQALWTEEVRVVDAQMVQARDAGSTLMHV